MDSHVFLSLVMQLSILVLVIWMLILRVKTEQSDGDGGTLSNTPRPKSPNVCNSPASMREHGECMEWLAIADAAPAQERLDYLQRFFNRFSSSRLLFSAYVDALREQFGSSEKKIASLSAIYEAITQYEVHCLPHEYLALQEEKRVIRQDSADAIKEAALDYRESHDVKLQEIEARAQEFFACKGSEAGEAKYEEIMQIDKQLDKSLIQREPDLNQRYRDIVDKVRKKRTSEKDRDYNTKNLSIMKDAYDQFLKSKKLLSRFKRDKVEPNKNEPDQEEDDNESAKATLPRKSIQALLELERIDHERLYPEIARYLSFVKTDVFNRMNRKEKLEYTKAQLEFRG